MLLICQIGVRMPMNDKYRDKNGEIMSVWDPKDDDKKTAVFSQIKRLIFAPYRALKEWAVCLYPGKRPKNLSNSEWDIMTSFFYNMMWLAACLALGCVILWWIKW